MIEWVLNALFFFLASLLLHEVGHYIPLRLAGHKPQIHFMQRLCVTVDKPLDKDTRMETLVSGVLIGLIPALLSMAFTILNFIVFIAYLYLCSDDIFRIVDLLDGGEGA